MDELEADAARLLEGGDLGPLRDPAGDRSRPDLEAKMDWGGKGRILVLEKA